MAVVFSFVLEGTRQLAAARKREYIYRKEIPH